MNRNQIRFYFGLLFLSFCSVFGQNVSLFNQFNGKYDFTFVGNTLNPVENTFQTSPSILTSSSESLNLSSSDSIESAYLYWAGCGTGDFEVKLNSITVQAERTFTNNLNSNFTYFGAFANVTDIVQNQGNGLYTLSELDVTNFVNFYALNSTNFGGWALVIVYKNNNLPLNQLNIYDGLQSVSSLQNNLSIQLNALNVIDNQDAKIGFLAWEGDVGLANNETLRINGNILSNPPLNPATNAFNGTNSVTGNSQLFNMDLDIYSIQDNIAIGDTSATIQLTSNQDFVMVNTIVTKLNSQLPDATINITNNSQICGSFEVLIDFEVLNTNSTASLPEQTPIAIYIDNQFYDLILTPIEIPIDGSWSGQAIVQFLNTQTQPFNIKIVVDDDGTNTGIIAEIIENNNSDSINTKPELNSIFNALEPIMVCNEGLTKGTFNFSHYNDIVKTNSNQLVSFHETEIEALENINSIMNTENYLSIATPNEIFVRIENENCFNITSFELRTRNCPPTVYNFISANQDGFNDEFIVEGLRDIFLSYQIFIYNRWGKLIWEGKNSDQIWNGIVQKAFAEKLAPEGTYYYIINLNDPNYTEPLVGFIYLTR